MNRFYDITGKYAYYLLRPLVYGLRYTHHRPRTRVIVNDEAGRILLVKTWFGRQRWGLPGGGLHKGEAESDGAVRELEEETGLRVTSTELVNCGRIAANDDSPFEMIIFAYRQPVRSARIPPARYPEIIALCWAQPDELPADTGPSVTRALRLLSAVDK